MTEEIIARKAAIRAEILAKRKAVPDHELARGSRLITGRLAGLDQWRRSSFPCIYVGSKPGEVLTTELIELALESGKRVCVPVIDPGDRKLRLVEITNLGDLVPGWFGILEPSAGFREQPADIPWDLAIVPGLAFDRLGHRIGFGAGYYDRLLSVRRTPRVAPAFGFQVIEPPFEPLPHDIDMDLIVTETATIEPPARS